MPECANCEAGSHSVKGTGVNAERCMAHGSSTFEESKSLGSSVDGISEPMLAGNMVLALTCRALLGIPDGTVTDGLVGRARIAYTLDIVIRAATRWVERGLPGEGLPCVESSAKGRARQWGGHSAQRMSETLGRDPAPERGLPEDPVARIGYVRNCQPHDAEMLTIMLRWNMFRGKHVTKQLEPCLCLSRAQHGVGFQLQWKIHELIKMNCCYSEEASTALPNLLLNALWKSKASFVWRVILKLS